MKPLLATTFVFLFLCYGCKKEEKEPEEPVDNPGVEQIEIELVSPSTDDIIMYRRDRKVNLDVWFRTESELEWFEVKYGTLKFDTSVSGISEYHFEKQLTYEENEHFDIELWQELLVSCWAKGFTEYETYDVNFVGFSDSENPTIVESHNTAIVSPSAVNKVTVVAKDDGWIQSVEARARYDFMDLGSNIVTIPNEQRDSIINMEVEYDVDTCSICDDKQIEILIIVSDSSGKSSVVNRTATYRNQ